MFTTSPRHMFGFIILYLDILPPWEPDNNIFMCKIMQISTISVIWLQRVLSPPTIMIFIFSLLHSVSNLTWKHKSLVSRIRWIIIIFYMFTLKCSEVCGVKQLDLSSTVHFTSQACKVFERFLWKLSLLAVNKTILCQLLIWNYL